MIHWRLYPFGRLALALMAGILLSSQVLVPLTLWVAAFFVLLTYSFYKEFISAYNHRHSLVAGHQVLTIFFLLGAVLMGVHQPVVDRKHYMHRIGSATEIEGIGVIAEIPEIKRSVRVQLILEHLCAADSCMEVSHEVMIYFDAQDSIAAAYHPGDRIWFQGRVTTVKTNTNPGVFDYKAYLWDKGISHQVFVKAGHIVVGRKGLGFLRQQAMDARAFCMMIFKKYLPDHDQEAIANAMILGYRGMVSEEMYRAFSDSGSVHILAVSGMHLAVLAEVLMFFFDRIAQRKSWVKYLKLVSLLAILWFFTLITGAAAAVVRSAVMFSLVLFGKYQRYHYNHFNILAFCAVAMLIYDPRLLFQASFQFSFLALLSLSFFYPFINSWYMADSRFVGWVWQYVSASMAAQILVLPITIYAFHKFPVYFLLSGFVPVWLSALALKLGLLIVILEPWSMALNEILASVFKFLLKMFINSVRWVDSLPMSSLDGLHFTTWEFWYLNVSLALFMIYLVLKRNSLLFFALSLISILGLSIGIRFYAASTQTKLTVYDVAGGSLADLFVGTTAIVLGGETVNPEKAAFVHKEHRASHFIGRVIKSKGCGDNFIMRNLIKQGNRIKVGKCIVSVVNNEFCEVSLEMDTGYGLLTNGVSWRPELKLGPGTVLIADGTIKGDNLRTWKRQAQQSGAQFYSIAERGAIVVDLKKGF
ncbi:MAG: ComEC family competence protein [Saprospiraceae bacterium]|nr:ComEC family competence protein [Saprospiraceae bacterium]